MPQPNKITVQPGETLLDIAMRTSIPVSQLLDLNPDFRTNLVEGADIRLPTVTPIRVGSQVNPPYKLPKEAPTQAGATFLGEFEPAFATWLNTITNPNIRTFIENRRNDINQEYIGAIGKAFLSGSIKDLSEAPDPLSFLQGINPQERFLSVSPFYRGEQGAFTGSVRPRKVRF